MYLQKSNQISWAGEHNSIAKSFISKLYYRSPQTFLQIWLIAGIAKISLKYLMYHAYAMRKLPLAGKRIMQSPWKNNHWKVKKRGKMQSKHCAYAVMAPEVAKQHLPAVFRWHGKALNAVCHSDIESYKAWNQCQPPPCGDDNEGRDFGCLSRGRRSERRTWRHI